MVHAGVVGRVLVRGDGIRLHVGGVGVAAGAGLRNITCRSNHKISHPTDAMVGTSSQAVCTNCHTEGDAGYRVAGQVHDQLAKLETVVNHSHQILDRAESDGMEISEARLDEEQSHDALLKARVTLHGFDPVQLSKDIEGGMKTADKAYKAGLAALAERDYRRKVWGCR